MRAAFRCLALTAIFASLVVLVMPAKGFTVPAPQKSSCCAHMKADTDNHDCGSDAPKSTQDRQCYLACAICLSFLFVPTKPFIFSRSGGEILATPFILESTRTDQPPTPPPRFRFV
jgi:hypothetical protein